MDERTRKAASYATDIPSPVLLRRRLSAPETIMRKHLLAQQRSDSQESEASHISDSRIPWKGEGIGSDPNLNKRKDFGLMRKSTLLRRLWNNSKATPGAKFSGSFYEWQHSFGKSTHSLNSSHSSPEHSIKSTNRRSLTDFSRTSPQHKAFSSRRMSPIRNFESREVSRSMNTSPKRKASLYNGNYDYSSHNTSSSNTTTLLDNRNSISETPNTESENSVRTNTSYTTFSDNSDSAFTYSKSTFSSSSNNTNNNEIFKQISEGSDKSVKDSNVRALENNSNNKLRTIEIKTKTGAKPFNSNESSTQTSDITNLNVISNVHLSQSTLDLIFNQVMKDVQLSGNNEVTMNTVPISVSEVKVGPQPRVINVQQVPSFYLGQKTEDNPDHKRIVKYMISNVGAGSPYTKPSEEPQVVPRYSALPRTSSMEVNTSSYESDDRDSETVSLVDSLEDGHSSKRRINNNIDEKPVRGDSALSPLLPDNSDKRRSPQRPASFFVPIEKDKAREAQSVSELLPDKVREKLTKRQQKREEKILQKNKLTSPRSDSNYVSASDNGNHFQYLVDNTDVNKNKSSALKVNYLKSKRKGKPLLPSIESDRRNKADEGKQKPFKRKISTTKHYSYNKNKAPDRLSPIYTCKNEIICDNSPRRIYHKTEFSNSNKRIEILEIMECIDSYDRSHQVYKGKSKIPVSSQRLPKIQTTVQKSNKPAMLDFKQTMCDPKLDQLIANILIDTLNNSCEENPKAQRSDAEGNLENNAHGETRTDAQQTSNDNEETINNNNCVEDASGSNNKKEDTHPTYKGKAAVAVVRDENLSTIPKGWITFYMLHKNQGSPDSTSDEGKNQNKLKEGDLHHKTVQTENLNKCYRPELLPGDSPSDLSTISCDSLKQSENQRIAETSKDRADVLSNGEWTVTVSGKSNFRHLAPDLELHLKFPTHKKKKDIYEDKIPDNRSCRLPEIPHDRKKKVLTWNYLSCSKCDYFQIGPGFSSISEPRQTKTSTRRYHLTRPQLGYPDGSNALNLFDKRQYAALLNRLPELLEISGNAMNSGRRELPSSTSSTSNILPRGCFN